MRPLRLRSQWGKAETVKIANTCETGMTNQESIRLFETDTLAGEFHHVDHVRLAFAYLTEYAPLEALERFSIALKGYAAARGKAQRYHDR